MGSPITQELHTEAEIVGSYNERNPLVLADRCDRCNAQAFVAAHHTDMHTLLFCGHHFSKHEAGLLGAGFEIQDERHRINEKPSVSANSD